MKNTRMQNEDFAVFILTHGRPDNVITFKTLRKQGYTGRIFFIIDNEDKTADRYYENFGRDKVVMFDKKAYADKVDEGNNFDNRKIIMHARNACFDIAKQVGVTYFMQLDDDYTEIKFRINGKGEYPSGRFLVRTLLNPSFDALIDFYKSVSAKSIAMSQGGDWIGGSDSSLTKYPLKRKAMNSFICSTERPFQFIGGVNEDVNTYTILGSRGQVFFTIPFIALDQEQTQSQDSGMTDFYLNYGTYVKSFTTVMMMPSSVKVSMMGSVNPRLHHRIAWNNTVPKIISESARSPKVTATKQQQDGI